MNQRSLVIAVVLVIAAGGAWWLLRAPATVAEPIKISNVPSAVTAAPATAPNTTSSPTASPMATDAPKATADPQAELSSAIQDIISLVENGNFMGLYERYTPPTEKAKLSADDQARLAQGIAEMTAHPEVVQIMLAGFQSLQNQAPQMNATGDEATYQMTMSPPPGTLPPGMTPPSRQIPMVFVKEDGKWYVKAGPN